MKEETIKLLNIVYNSLGNNRYMRTLEIADNKHIFVNSPLNLGFIKATSQEELKQDFEITSKFIELNGVKI